MELPEGKILVEVLTLDSLQWPCCWYMVDVLNTFLPPEVRAFIEYREWSIKTTEGVHMFVERGGRVIPTLCMNGRRTHESVIPTLDELYDELSASARTDEQRRVLEAARVAAAAAYEGTDAGGRC